MHLLNYYNVQVCLLHWRSFEQNYEYFTPLIALTVVAMEALLPMSYEAS